MLFDWKFLIAVSILLVIFIIVGIIILIVMKKLKKSESRRAMLSVAVAFAGVILAGILVYGVTMAMLMNLAIEQMT